MGCKSDMKYISGAELVRGLGSRGRPTQRNGSVQPLFAIKKLQGADGRCKKGACNLQPYKSTAGRLLCSKAVCMGASEQPAGAAARRQRPSTAGAARSSADAAGGIAAGSAFNRGLPPSPTKSALWASSSGTPENSADLLNSVGILLTKGLSPPPGPNSTLGGADGSTSSLNGAGGNRKFQRPQSACAGRGRPSAASAFSAVLQQQAEARVGVQGLAGLLRASSGATKAWGPAAADADSQPQSSVTRANELQDAARQKAQQLFTRLAQQAAQPAAAPAAPKPALVRPHSAAPKGPNRSTSSSAVVTPSAAAWPPRPLRSLRCRHSSRCWPKSDEPRRRRRSHRRRTRPPRSLLQQCACAAALRRSQHEQRKRPADGARQSLRE